MYKQMMLGLVFTAALITGCSGGSGESDQRPDQIVVADSVAAPAAADPHAGHDMGDSAAGSDRTGMAAMDHSAHGSGAPADAPDHTAHGGVQGTDHGAAAGRSAAAAGAGGADHSAHAAAAGPGRTAGAAGQAMDHSRHTAAASLAGGQTAAARSHAGMAHVPAGSSGRTGSLPAGHAQHDEVEDKLMMLVAELVQDSVVQLRIQQDPVLREQWQDPGVRQIILRRQ